MTHEPPSTSSTPKPTRKTFPERLRLWVATPGWWLPVVTVCAAILWVVTLIMAWKAAAVALSLIAVLVVVMLIRDYINDELG